MYWGQPLANSNFFFFLTFFSYISSLPSFVSQRKMTKLKKKLHVGLKISVVILVEIISKILEKKNDSALIDCPEIFFY